MRSINIKPPGSSIGSRSSAHLVFITIIALLVAIIGVPAFSSQPARATEPVYNAENGCPIDTIVHSEVSHQEFKYSKTTSAKDEVTQNEYRWFRNYAGPKEVEGVEYVKGAWVVSSGWHVVPAHLNPPNNLVVGQTGSFSGSNKPYGLPNSPYTINWRYQGGQEWWPSETGWATNLDGAGDGAWGNPVASRTVVLQEATPETVVFYLPGGGQSTDNTDANWTTEVPSAPWVKIDERKVVDQESWVETVYGPCPPEFGVCESMIGPISVFENTAATFGFGQTFQRDGGSLAWVEDGIVFSTPLGNDKITFGITSEDFIIPLHELTALSYTIEHLAAGTHPQQRLSFNVPVDVNGAAAAGGWTTIVVEPVYNGMSLDGFQNGDAVVWSSNAIPGFPNRDTFKSWNELLDANPDAVILGQILVNQGGGNAGLSDKLTSLTVGNSEACATYTFAKEPPVITVDPAPWATIVGQCVAEPGTGSEAIVNAENPAPTEPNTVTTDVDVVVKVDGVSVHEVTLVSGGKLENYRIPFAEDTGVHLVQIYGNGVLLASVEVGSDCALNVVEDPPVVDPGPPSCDADGTRKDPTADDNWTFSWDREFDGPGDYWLEYKAVDGKTFQSGETITRKVTVLGATGFQSTDSSKPCYKKPPTDIVLAATGPSETGNLDWRQLLLVSAGLLGIGTLLVTHMVRGNRRNHNASTTVPGLIS